MKKQEYIDMGLESGLSLPQIEGVLCRIMQLSPTQLFTLQELSSKYIYEVQKTFYKIKSGVPEAYSLESTDFYGRSFFVDPRVLIPRNDTEILVKAALNHIHTNNDVSQTVYIDVGTGSACIPVSILLEMHPLKFFQSFALDISQDALHVAKKNSDTYVPGKIELWESNLLEAIFFRDEIQGKHLCITANLPYIKAGDTKNMDTNVLEYEPHSALFWGEKTGFELYERLIKQCFQLQQIQKIKSIHLFIEIGFDQYELSKKFLEDLWLSFEYFLDNASIYRVIHIQGF